MAPRPAHEKALTERRELLRDEMEGSRWEDPSSAADEPPHTFRLSLSLTSDLLPELKGLMRCLR